MLDYGLGHMPRCLPFHELILFLFCPTFVFVVNGLVFNLSYRLGLDLGDLLQIGVLL